MAITASLPLPSGRLPTVRVPAQVWSEASWRALGLPTVHVALTVPQRWAVALLQADPDLARWRNRARWHAALTQLDPLFDRAQARRLLKEIHRMREQGTLVAVDQAQACRHRWRCVSPHDRVARVDACLQRLRQVG